MLNVVCYVAHSGCTLSYLKKAVSMKLQVGIATSLTLNPMRNW